MNEVIYFMLSAGILVVLLIFLLNFGSKGEILKILRVIGSRGKNIYVRIQSATDKYGAIGKYKESFLTYKTRDGVAKSIIAPRKLTYLYAGVWCVDVDEAGDRVMNPESYEVVQGHDTSKVDSLIQRILMAPRLDDSKIMIILIMLVVVLLAVGFGMFTLYNELQVIKVLITAATSVQTTGVL